MKRSSSDPRAPGRSRPRKAADSIPARRLTAVRVRRALRRERVPSLEEFEQRLRDLPSLFASITPEQLRLFAELERADPTYGIGRRGPRLLPGKDAA